jgi:hypothetical protein
MPRIFSFNDVVRKETNKRNTDKQDARRIPRPIASFKDEKLQRPSYSQDYKVQKRKNPYWNGSEPANNTHLKGTAAGQPESQALSRL